MFNVMIVEDSKPIARNIKQQVETVQPQLRVTAMAFNGLEALEELRQHPIDLVITDIRMPKMDGLTFIREARRINPDLIFLILSGYSDFEYARQALRLGVTEYLLKPLDVNELSATLDRVAGQLSSASRRRLADEIAESISLGSKGGLHWPAHWRGYRMAVARSGYFKFGGTPLDREELERLCPVCFPGSECIVADSPGEAEKIVIIARPKDSPEFDRQMERFHGQFQTIHHPAYVSYSAAETCADRMIPLYKRLTRFLDRSVKPGLPQCWFADGAADANSQQPEAPKEGSIAACVAFVRNNRAEALKEELDRLAAHWERHQFSVYQIKVWLYELFREASPVFHHDMVDELLAISGSYRDIGRNVMQELSSLMKREEPKGDLMRSVDHFFRANLHRQISMQELCRALNYSPTYIIRVVKQYRGMTPIEYFNKLKIDEARRMLDSSDSIKIKDVAEALGFSNQHYFSKVFKQYAGCNPSEYK